MFEDEGHKLLLDPMVEREWEQTPPNADAVRALNDHFNSMVPINPSPDCRALATISFKGDLERLKNHDGFDSIIVSRARGNKVERTKTGRTLDVMGSMVGVPGGDSDSLSFDIGVVDRASGSLLYYCSSVAGGDYVGRPDERLSGPIGKCLDHYFHGKRR